MQLSLKMAYSPEPLIEEDILIQSDLCLKHVKFVFFLMFSYDQLVTLKNHWATSSCPEHLKRGSHLHLHRAGSIRLGGSQLLFVRQVCGLNDSLAPAALLSVTKGARSGSAGV